MSGGRARTIRRKLLAWLPPSIGLLILAYLRFGLDAYRSPAVSMEPTLLAGDRFLADRLAYLFAEPQPGDVVVFRHPRVEGTVFVKRIVARAGDEVEVGDGELRVNRVRVAEPYARWALSPGLSLPGRGAFGPERVPAASYFVLGDNRYNSDDSRFWGSLPRDHVLGKVRWVYFSRDPTTGRTRWRRIGKTVR